MNTRRDRRRSGNSGIAAGVLAGLILVTGWTEYAASQELTPRAYWPAPKGTRIAVAGYSYVSGNVLLDPTAPISGADGKVHTGIVGYVQTIDLLGRTANLVAELPYAWGTTTGLLGGSLERRDVSGLGDLAVTLSVNLLGAPSMTPTDFQALRADPHPILGASLRVVAPTGRYDSGRLVNVGGNRWATRLELGSIFPFGPPWLLEVDAGAWFLGDDADFVAGRREQNPIFELQVHLVRRFKPGFWASLDLNYFTGGRQTIGGEKQAAVQDNSRIGATVVVPFQRRHAIKLAYFKDVRTGLGSDADQLLVAYQVLFPPRAS